jgi:hypothetical protein
MTLLHARELGELMRIPTSTKRLKTLAKEPRLGV